MNQNVLFSMETCFSRSDIWKNFQSKKHHVVKFSFQNLRRCIFSIRKMTLFETFTSKSGKAKKIKQNLTRCEEFNSKSVFWFFSGCSIVMANIKEECEKIANCLCMIIAAACFFGGFFFVVWLTIESWLFPLTTGSHFQISVGH